LGDLLVGILLADPGERRLQKAPTKTGILLAQGVARGAADGRARLAGERDALPGGGWRLAPGGEDLHLIAVPELGRERHLPAVDDRTDAGVADVGMDGVGEI